ncbi:unnamed protein product [Darwinula stevensoni]|uniref:Septin n=1 Tax=Darwinula stevensoni TaxID=69355 RepID=A0A7R8WYX6_9CRUS|nr:unnamed protein product [Darwinula stevensoni]CAG0879593.1 unnamed protein product [Darwinula stevensoni]
MSRGEIGFATLPEQVHRKSVKRGFEFTLMVAGETGLGKSTLINSLFLTDLYKDRQVPDVHGKIEKTISIEKKTMEIEEKGVRLRLSVVDTPGFGDSVNCEEHWQVLDRYLTDQFKQYFEAESGLNRKSIQDNRVHCLLYFIPPYGRGLRQLDVEVMKKIHKRVNLVPVIAKADMLTQPEVKFLKECIKRDIKEHHIKIYKFPECDSDEDEEFRKQDRDLKTAVPFALIGSSQTFEVNGRRIRGRLYPWGVVDVEDPGHSDFVKLRTMLISTHMQDLKEVTHDVLYENFRTQQISQMSQPPGKERKSSPLTTGFSSILPPHASSLHLSISKLKRGSIHADQVSETDKLLQQKDEEIRRMQDMLQQMQEKLRASGKGGIFSESVEGRIGLGGPPSKRGSRDSIIDV